VPGLVPSAFQEYQTVPNRHFSGVPITKKMDFWFKKKKKFQCHSGLANQRGLFLSKPTRNFYFCVQCTSTNNWNPHLSGVNTGGPPNVTSQKW
jgi:hypothetical protein